MTEIDGTILKKVNNITLRTNVYEGNLTIKEVNTANVPWKNNDMSNAFQNCFNLENVTLLNDDVSEMNRAFQNCSNLYIAPNIPRSTINMYACFNNCSKMEIVNEIPFNVEDMSYAFNNCTKLETPGIFIQGYDEENNEEINPKVQSLEYTYAGTNISIGPNLTYCYSLTNMFHTFDHCKNLTGIKTIPNNVSNMDHTFVGCANFIGQVDTGDIESINYYGYNAQECLENDILDEKVSLYFSQESQLSESSTLWLYIEDISELTQEEKDNREYIKDYEKESEYEKYYVYQCDYDNNKYKITPIDNVEDNNIIDDTQIYEYKITRNEVFDFITIRKNDEDFYYNALYIPDSVTNMYGTFAGCSSMTNMPIFNNGTLLEDLSESFYRCQNLSEVIDISQCSRLTNIQNTFYNCTNISDGIDVKYIVWKSLAIGDDKYFSSLYKEINDEASNELNIGDILYNVNKTIEGEDLYAYIFENGIIVYVDTLSLEPGDKIYQYDVSNKTKTEYGTVVSISENTITVMRNNSTYILTRDEDKDIKSENIYNFDFNDYIIINGVDKIDIDNYEISYDYPTGTTNTKLIQKLKEEIYTDVFKQVYIMKINYGNIKLPDSITDMRNTFNGCINLIETSIIPINVLDLSSTFYGCSNLNHVTETIPSSVTNMYKTFYGCSNLSGDIVIRSSLITNAYNCFNGTSVENLKNVYIPFKDGNDVYTNTYNAFIDAGYKTDERIDGVLIYELTENEDILRDYDYDKENEDEDGFDAELYNYHNENEGNIETPNV